MADTKSLKTVSEVIDAFGGTGKTARLFGVLPSAVSNWRTVAKFPDRLHFRILREAEASGIAVDDAVFVPVAATNKAA